LPLPDLDADRLRARVENAVIPIWPKDVAIEKISGPVAGEWQRPAAIRPGRVLYYFHGGGYFFGSPRTHRTLTMRLAKAAAAPLFSLGYRMAPEHACPAALDDAEVGWRYLLSSGARPENVFVGGDSAGGGLALALMQRLRDQGAAQPAGAFLYSPWTDLAARGAAVDENARADAMFTADTIRRGGARYAGALALDDPRVSPLYGAFEGLAPLQIFASRSEILRDDSVRVADKARAAGVKVELTLEEGLVHVWPLFAHLMPEAGRTIAQTVAFIRRGG
jgi:acetyl esterase/lipase